MYTCRLYRIEDNYVYGTFGVFSINSRAFCVTLEPPDNLNKTSISSIPAGQYDCRRYSSDRYPDTFQVMNVPDRYKILFHAGNFDEDTEGCILVGRNTQRGKVLRSKETFDFLMEQLIVDKDRLLFQENLTIEIR